MELILGAKVILGCGLTCDSFGWQDFNEEFTSQTDHSNSRNTNSYAAATENSEVRTREHLTPGEVEIAPAV